MSINNFCSLLLCCVGSLVSE